MLARRASVNDVAPVRYATLSGGGSGGKTTVKTLAELTAALKGDTKKGVVISGTITGNAVVCVGSHTSILGTANSSFVGVGHRVLEERNLSRDVKTSKVLASAGNAIGIQQVKQVWVDHVDLSSEQDHDKDFYDGLFDVTHGSTSVNISNSKPHNHFKTSLVGNSHSNGAQDKAITVTYTGNYFSGPDSRTLSSDLEPVTSSATSLRTTSTGSAPVLVLVVENNNGAKKALFSTDHGFAVVQGNDFGGATNDTPTGTFTKAHYLQLGKCLVSNYYKCRAENIIGSGSDAEDNSSGAVPFMDFLNIRVESLQILNSFHGGPTFVPYAPIFMFVDHKNLFNLSLVCTSLSSAALDVLWTTVSELYPLLKLLMNTVQENDSNPVDITGEIDDHQWNRFQIYCHRIRHLIVDGNSMSEATAIKLYHKNGDAPLLPNLYSLSLAVNPSTNWPELRIFLSPSIDIFQLRNPQMMSFPNHPNIRRLIKKLPKVWKAMGDSLLQIDINPGVVSCQLDIPTSLRLQGLTVQPQISYSDFSLISQLSALASLIVVLKDDDPNTPLFPTPDAGKFPNLMSLSYIGPASCVFPILQRIESPTMLQLGISTTSKTSSWWSELSSLVTTRWGHTLYGLEFIQTGLTLETPQFFQPSDSIPSITHLILAGGFIGDFLDFEFIAQSSRTLSTLSIGVFGKNTYLSWDILPMMRQLLPTLIELRITIRNHNVSALAIDDTLASSLANDPHPLRVLRLYSVNLGPEIPNDNIPLIARFIDKLFPQAEVVPSDDDTFDPLLYQDIQKQVVAVRKARGYMDWSPETDFDAAMRTVIRFF